MPKNFHCSGCGGQHKRPVGVKCQFKDDINVESSSSNSMNSNSNTDTNTTDSVNHDIISALTSVSSRLSAIEQRIQKKGRNNCNKGLRHRLTASTLPEV